MNPAVKILWLQALRSGKYQQTRNWLKRTKDGKAEHCCLGVLCEIAKVVGIVQEIELEHEHTSVCDVSWHESAFVTNTCVSYAIPPNGVLSWAGLTRSEAENLGDINDNGAPFSLIADHIELRF